MAAYMNASDLYGSAAPKIFGMNPEKTVIASSGNIKAMVTEQNKPVFSWLALAAVLILLRFVWELA